MSPPSLPNLVFCCCCIVAAINIIIISHLAKGKVAKKVGEAKKKVASRSRLHKTCLITLTEIQRLKLRKKLGRKCASILKKIMLFPPPLQLYMGKNVSLVLLVPSASCFFLGGGREGYPNRRVIMASSSSSSWMKNSSSLSSSIVPTPHFLSLICKFGVLRWLSIPPSWFLPQLFWGVLLGFLFFSPEKKCQIVCRSILRVGGAGG